MPLVKCLRYMNRCFMKTYCVCKCLLCAYLCPILFVMSFQSKLELITGGTAGNMKLSIFDKDNQHICNLSNDDALLGSYQIDSGMRLHVCIAWFNLNFHDMSNKILLLCSDPCMCYQAYSESNFNLANFNSTKLILKPIDQSTFNYV